MKKGNLSVLITLAVLSFTTTTAAANWQHIWTQSTINLYVDAESIASSPGGIKEAWFRYDYSPPDCANITGKCIDSSVVYARYFSDKSMCDIQETVYFQGGQQKTTGLSCAPIRIIPGTFNEICWEYLYR